MGGVPGVDIGIVKALQFIKEQNIDVNYSIKLAVLDEGVDIKHPEFSDKGMFYGNFSMYGDRKNPLPLLEDHHGTNVAGVIAAVQKNQRGIAGINPFVQIMIGRIYYTEGGPHVDPLRIADGIRIAVDRGAQVINLSWRLKNFSPVVADAIRYGYDKGILFCAAAGNYMSRNGLKEVAFPGMMDEVITVGACNHRGEWTNLSNTPADARFGSCYGREMDILAPGLYIPTTMNDGGYTYNFFGTSAATAIVSAVAALVLAVRPSLTAIQVREILLSTCDEVYGDSTIPYFHRAGYGRINAFKAVKKALS